MYRALYTLTDSVGQMRDYCADALCSTIPLMSLASVFIEQDGVAEVVGETVSERMHAYGYVVEDTLITAISVLEDGSHSLVEDALETETSAADDVNEE